MSEENLESQIVVDGDTAPRVGLRQPPKPGTSGPIVRWNRREIKLVAQQCARLFRHGVTKFTAKHFMQGQAILTTDRRKKQFCPSMIEILRREIAEVPMPIDPEENTAAVHDGTYNSMVPDLSNNGHSPVALAENYAARPQIKLSTQPSVTSATCEQLVAILVDINLKALALKGFTSAQIEQAVVNKIDRARLRNLTIQGNNALTYFEQILRIA